MAWVKVESSVARNAKFQDAGPAASWLWLCGLAYCQEGLTDGFIPFKALPFLGVKSPSKHAAALVKARLWEQCEGGWRVHDYLQHNKPAAEIRKIGADRRVAGAEGGRQSGIERRKQSAEANAKQAANPATATAVQTAEATAPVASAAPQPRAPIIASHIKHVVCGRICLHVTQFSEFVARRNHRAADQEIREWAMDVVIAWNPGGPHEHDEPGDSFQFWKARYAERWPASRAAGAVTKDEPEWARKARLAKAGGQ